MMRLNIASRNPAIERRHVLSTGDAPGRYTANGVSLLRFALCPEAARSLDHRWTDGLLLSLGRHRVMPF